MVGRSLVHVNARPEGPRSAPAHRLAAGADRVANPDNRQHREKARLEEIQKPGPPAPVEWKTGGPVGNYGSPVPMVPGAVVLRIGLSPEGG